jgi:hypothetical protein
MRTIALISQKGGVGKTTLAIHLATAFAAAGYNTLLLDLDPQASAAEWKDSRAAETPPVMAIPPARLAKVMESSQSVGTDVLILDTAPHSEGTALEASRAADLILVPCQPSIRTCARCAKPPASWNIHGRTLPALARRGVRSGPRPRLFPALIPHAFRLEFGLGQRAWRQHLDAGLDFASGTNFRRYSA